MDEEVPEVSEEQSEQQPEKSVNEVAKEALAGKWGRGQMRKQRLQEAGYNPAEVQEEIGRIIRG